MPAGIIVAVVAVVVVAALAMGVMTAARRRRLRQRFGPEYDRVVGERDSKRKAEAELTRRERRVRALGIHPLTDSTRAGYTRRWASLQERFADMPADAVAASQILVADVMNERGYPTDDRDQVLADLSVEHAKTLDHYRAAEEISEYAGAGMASTEHLRQAMIHYREVFRELLGAPADPSGQALPGRSFPGPLGPDHPSKPGAEVNQVSELADPVWQREAAELGTVAAKMTAERGGVSADVVESPAIPAKPATGPGALPVAEPAARPVTEPQTRPTAKPVSRPQRGAAENLTRPAMPATRPGVRPGISRRRTPNARPGAKPKSRQVRAWRKMAAAVVVFSLAGLTTAATEIGLHGFSFFIFRSAGTGATSGSGVPENQGPGQPGAHHKAQAGTSSGKASGKAGKPK